MSSEIASTSRGDLRSRDQNDTDIIEMENLTPSSEMNNRQSQLIRKASICHKSKSQKLRYRFSLKFKDDSTGFENCYTLFSDLLKASLSTGILAMPIAFKNSGLTLGIFFTILVALVYTHCAYIVVKCAHVLYFKICIGKYVDYLSFAEVGEAACSHGPLWSRKFAKLVRVSILVGMFLSNFGTCSVYTVIIGSHLQQVIDYHLGFEINERIYIISLLVPLILLTWLLNFRETTLVTLPGNMFLVPGLGITLYYLLHDLPSLQDMPSLTRVTPVVSWPISLSICIFVIQGFVAEIPLLNSLSNPNYFIGVCGMFNKGMGALTMVYILLGVLGFVKYGEETQGVITLNLPTEDLLAQSAKILVGLAMFFKIWGLQYPVCFTTVWNEVKDRFLEDPQFDGPIVVGIEGPRQRPENVARALMTIASVLFAVTMMNRATIGPFIGLIGAFCFSLLGLIIPIFIEIVTYWDIGFGPRICVILKNIPILIFGLLILFFGTYTSLEEITALYAPVVEEAKDLFNRTGMNASEVFNQLKSIPVVNLNETEGVDGMVVASAVEDAVVNGTKAMADSLLKTNHLSWRRHAPGTYQ